MHSKRRAFLFISDISSTRTYGRPVDTTIYNPVYQEQQTGKPPRELLYVTDIHETISSMASHTPDVNSSDSTAGMHLE